MANVMPNGQIFRISQPRLSHGETRKQSTDERSTDERTPVVTSVSVVLDKLENLLNWFLLELQFFPVYPSAQLQW